MSPKSPEDVTSAHDASLRERAHEGYPSADLVEPLSVNFAS